MSLELSGGCWRQYSSSMKGVCAKIYMLGSFEKSGMDSLLPGFACWFFFFCRCLLVFPFSPNQTFGTLWHTGKKVGGLVSSLQATHTFPSSLFLFLSSYPEIHFPVVWVVSLAWAPQYCGGKSHKSRVWFSVTQMAQL